MTTALTLSRQPQPSTATVTGPLVAAIERTCAAIQDCNPEVLHVVLTLGNGSQRSGQLTYGHVHDAKWATWREPAAGAVHRRRRSAPWRPRVLGTLLHEAVHGLAAIRGIKDTSRQGRDRNAKFRDIAAELGITVTKDPRLGWSPDSVPDLTTTYFADQVAELEEAVTAYRRADVPANKTRSNNGIVVECGCEAPRKIRLSRSTYERGPIYCDLCGPPFTDTSDEG